MSLTFSPPRLLIHTNPPWGSPPQRLAAAAAVGAVPTFQEQEGGNPVVRCPSTGSLLSQQGPPRSASQSLP